MTASTIAETGCAIAVRASSAVIVARRVRASH